jgi:nucleoside-diphosphate-sugar epimerase
LEGGGDWIHASDVAEAIRGLLRTPKLSYGVYNIAYGRFVTLRELLDVVTTLAPGLTAVTGDPEDSDVACDPSRRSAGWGGYDIRRVEQDTGWKPAPIEVRMAEYLAWLRGTNRDRKSS